MVEIGNPFKAIAHRWDRWKRRQFGRYHIRDPRPIAEEAHYTFFLPTENQLLALRPGDLAKLIFAGEPGGPTFEAERMWVWITGRNGNDLVGTLGNTPFELHQLHEGDVVNFRDADVIDIVWADDRERAPPPPQPHREYWERCMVDRCVLDDGIAVYSLYREEADMGDPDDEYPDSGWRIRGDYRGLSDEEMAQREHDYIAIGKVLNADDSWLHLIDSPVGSTFIRDEQTNEFIPCEN